MRYPASEKLEIIQLVEQSHLPVRRTLAQLGIAPSTFYRWYDLYQSGGPEAAQVQAKNSIEKIAGASTGDRPQAGDVVRRAGA